MKYGIGYFRIRTLLLDTDIAGVSTRTSFSFTLCNLSLSFVGRHGWFGLGRTRTRQEKCKGQGSINIVVDHWHSRVGRVDVVGLRIIKLGVGRRQGEWGV